MSVSGIIALCHTGLPHRYSGEPEEGSQTPYRGGAQGSQEELLIDDLFWHVVGQGLTQGEVYLEGEREEEKGRKIGKRIRRTLEEKALFPEGVEHIPPYRFSTVSRK